MSELDNRDTFEWHLALEAGRSRRYKHPISLALFDLEGLDTVTERLGPEQGDAVLTAVSKIFADTRLSDQAFRIDGETFALLMPETDERGAHVAAARICAMVRSLRVADGTIIACYGVAESAGDPLLLHWRAAADLLIAKEQLREEALKLPAAWFAPG
jgi:diguanylate cyclase (GGDEF)-like protein